MDEFYEFKKLRGDISAAIGFKAITEILSELAGVDVRHVAIGLSQEDVAEPIIAAPDDLDKPLVEPSAVRPDRPNFTLVVPEEELTLPRACASAVKASVAHLRTELALAGMDEKLRTAVQHFHLAATRALTRKVPVQLHGDRGVNGWLLHGARQLLASGRTHRDRLRDIVGLLAQAGAEVPRGHVGTALARVRSLGAGSYGEVWQAIRVENSTPVAVKQCHARDGKPPDARLVDALRKEATCLMRLSHKSIPRFVACDFDRPDPYLAMQFVEGERLGDWLLRNPPTAELDFVLRALFAAVAYAHSLGIHHRDLKAENILIAPGPRPFVIDWGGAKTVLPEQQTATPGFHANIRNSAPECILHVRENSEIPFPYTAKQDMWSLGVIAHHVLSGRHPFDAPGDPLRTIENVLRLEPPPLPAECGHWVQLVAALLQRNPDKRLGSCTDAINALDRAATATTDVDDAPEQDGVPDLDEILDEALPELGDRMVDMDDVLTGEMAMTNATGFRCDAHYVHSARYDIAEETIYFEAELHFSGDQNEDQMWSGDAFTVQISGQAVQQMDNGVEKWTVDDYHVNKCVADHLEESLEPPMSDERPAPPSPTA